MFKRMAIAGALLVYSLTSPMTFAASSEGPYGASFVLPPEDSVSVDGFFKRFGAQIGLTDDDSMVRVKRGHNSISQLDFVTYQQHHRGVPVLGAGVTISHRKTQVVSALVHVVPYADVVNDVKFDAAEALKMARKIVAKKLAKPVDEILWMDNHQVQLVLDPTGSENRLRFAYQCQLHIEYDLRIFWVRINAEDQSLILYYPGGFDSWSATTVSGDTLFDGPIAGVSGQTDGIEYRLQSDRVRTQTLKNATPGDWYHIIAEKHLAEDILSSSDAFFDPSTDPGFTVHWATEETMDIFHELFGVDVLSGDVGTFDRFENIVDAPLNTTTVAGTFTNPYIGTIYGHLNGPAGDVDVVGHEIGHVLSDQINSVPEPEGGGERGALNESFSDIMGQVVEYLLLGHTDWISAGRSSVPEVVKKSRNLRFPNQSTTPQPDLYQGPYWMPTAGPHDQSNDWGGIHINTGVQNRWFYLVSEGTPGSNSAGIAYDVHGFGIIPASKIVFSCYQRIGAAATFQDARECTLLAANEICGEYSREWSTVHEAWKAVGLDGPATSSAFTKPSDGTTGIDPWNVELAFQIEDIAFPAGWVVQLSPHHDFSDEVTELWTDHVVDLTGIPVAKTEIALDAETTYYWRVRPASTPDDFECWRAPRSFTTSEEKVQLISPVSGNREVHPWDLRFSWHALTDAETYTVQVSTDPTYSSLLFPEITTSDCEFVGDVLVSEKHYWRVRATTTNQQGQLVSGSWSEGQFTTSMPTVQLLSPSPGEQVYPWPIILDWDDVVGVDHYLLQLTLTRSGFGDSSGILESIVKNPGDTSHRFNVAADDWSIYYSWRVIPVGPKIGPIPIQEEGQPGQRTLFVRGPDTWAENLTSAENTCANLHVPTPLEWTSVHGATAYTVRVQQALCPQGSSCYSGPQIGAPSSIMTTSSGIIQYSYVPEPISDNDYIGFFYTVQAFGPGGAPGFPNRMYIPVPIQPTAPQLLSPDNNSVFEKGEDLSLWWSSEMAHWGGFVYKLYKGSGAGCTPSYFISDSIQTYSSGITEQGFTNLQIDGTNHQHSWQVRPWVLTIHDADGNALPQHCNTEVWSECRTFRVVENTTPPQIPDEIWFNGTLDLIHLSWKIVNGADRYEVLIREGAKNGPTFIPLTNYSAAQLAANRDFLIQYYSTNYGVSFPGYVLQRLYVFYEGANPLETYYAQVRACKGSLCSAWARASK